MDGLPFALDNITPAEEVVLHLLRDRLPDISVQSLIRRDQEFPFLLIRRIPTYGEWGGDPRFLDSAQISAQSFVSGEDADREAGELLVHVVDILFDESKIRRVVPQKGHLLSSLVVNSPRRVTDWATATGPVQYADLPSGVSRYEMTLSITTRKPVKRRP